MDNCYQKPINYNLSSNSRISNPVAISDHVKKKEPMMEKHPSSTPAGGTSDSGAGEHVPPSGKIVTPNLKSFTLSELRSATRNFSPDTLLGEGGFGRVFKGWVDGETYAPSKVGIGIAVAIKKLNRHSDQGHKEFLAEIEFLGKCRHSNLVNLLGFCQEDREFLLVYEYLQKGSLENHLFKKGAEPLTWSTRIKIAIGVAQGLSFLHATTKNVIHRYVKSANILLDGDFNAKLSDFGLAKLSPVNGDSRRVVGTYGYVAPEYIATGRLYVKSDVYSFGVVLLETITGLRVLDTNRPRSQHNLVDWARSSLLDIQKLRKIIDPRLEHDLPLKAACRTAELILACLEPDLKNRPTMKSVLVSLQEIGSIKSKPKETKMLDYAAAYYCKGVDGETYPPSKVGIGMSVAAKKSNPDSLQRLQEWQENNKDPYRFSLEDIILILTSLNQGFGRLYRGNVRGNGHYTIAAKRLDTSHGQGETEFYNELQIFKKNVDKNIIGLVGYCNETDEKILVYEYASRGSLDKYLNDVSLTWENRLKICINVATGLDFLHGRLHWQETIIHRDIRAANILLSNDLEAKIGDFGLSMESTINQDEDYVIDHVCGTIGYLDPSGFLTRESDIYSFGVVLIDIVSGRSTYEICHQKGQYLPSFIKQKVYYLNFSKRNWTEMTLLSFIGLILLAAPTCSATAGSWSGDPDDEGLISLADHKNIFQVVPGDVKNVWNEWVLRGLILISLISQIALCLLGYIRKYNWRTPVRMGLWCTCLLAYSVVPAALGMLTQTNSEPTPPVAQPHRLNTSELMSFWAPFLFLHLGGPDSITAFALEDSELYLRYFVEMVFLSVVALYILLQSWPGYSYLPQLSILVYLAGFVKCSERIQALRLANTGYLRNSMLSPPDPGPNHQKILDDEVPETLFQTGNKGSGTVISDAYDLFQTFKQLFEDLILTFEDRDGSRSYFRHLRSDDAFHIVEIELGFAFDMLYTKANAVYTLMGLMLRLTSFFFLLMVLVCLYIFYDMDSYPSIDIVITHLLVGLAIFMEIFSVITMLCSDWTDNWLSQRDLTRNILVFPFLKHPTKRRWSGSIGQFDLLNVAIEEKPATCLKIQKFFGIDFTGVKHRYKALSKVSDNLKHLIYSHFRELIAFNFSPKELCSHKGSFSLQKNECDSLLWSTTKVEFDQSILIWHIATSLCYYSELDNQEDGDIYTCRKESKRISDYLLYLLVTYPWMLPAGIGMVRYRDTCAEAMHFFKEKGPKTAKVEACTKLIEVNCMEVLPCKVKDGRSKSALSDGCRLALALKEMGRERMWKVVSQVWIEILGYAATHCRGIHHKQHLGKGGEFLTHVWLLMAHLGITEQFQVAQGHARARLNVC